MERLPFVFLRTEARAEGLTDKALRGPLVQRVLHGVYVRAGVTVDVRVRTLAALRLAPAGTVAAGSTAAVLLGGVVPPDHRIHLRLPHGQLRRKGTEAGTLRSRGGLPGS
ncbi:hypothetical protein GCM10009867_36270 [Pedococcus aerophilus]|uniref:Uncharacterized protein n=1 Tax=Pedococcus aerophilus TaxID=436356 RepID=A0ABP6HCG7_9MICO